MAKKINLKKGEVITRVNYLINFDEYQKQDYQIVSVNDSNITLAKICDWEWIGIPTQIELPLEDYGKCFHDEDEGFISIYASISEAGERAIQEFIPEFQKLHPEIEFDFKRERVNDKLKEFLVDIEKAGDLYAFEKIREFLQELRLDCFKDIHLVFVKKLIQSLIELNYCQVEIEQGHMPYDDEMEELYLSLRRKLIEYVEKEVI